jgi:ABC-2 type transport system ATP-binding protein
MSPRSRTSTLSCPAPNTWNSAASCAAAPAALLREKIGYLLTLLGLYEDRHSPLSGYSKGMRQKILLAGALLHNPGLLLLDEPFSGLDVAAALMLRGLIQRLAAFGKTILFSSHDLDTVEKVSARVVILHRGRVVADGASATLRDRLAAPSLEDVFRRLAIEQDPDRQAAELLQVVTQ